MKAYQLSIAYQKDRLLTTMNCYKNSSSYEILKELLENLIVKHIDEIDIVGYTAELTENSLREVVKLQGFEFENAWNPIACIVTLGNRIDKRIEYYFEHDMYIEGLLLSELCNQILFNGTKELHIIIDKELEINHLYIKRKIEPGARKIPLKIQSILLSVIQEKYSKGSIISLTEGYMFSPSKTISYYYEITNCTTRLQAEHDCSACEMKECSYGCKTIEIKQNSEVHYIGPKRKNIFLDLVDNNIIFPATCGGNGTCGKCKVKVIDSNKQIKLNDLELQLLSKNEIDDGYVLACYHKFDEIAKNSVIEVPIVTKDKKEIVSEFSNIDIENSKYNKGGNKYCVAIDIGTTTVVAALINCQSAEVVCIKKCLNPQRSYGADVISRILFAKNDESKRMGGLIKQCIANLINGLYTELLEVEKKLKFIEVESLIIAGNTTMTYLLLDYDASDLAIAPFKTKESKIITTNILSLFGDDLVTIIGNNCMVTILPWISAYVGGDIISGIYGIKLHEMTDNILFVDIGTNGEVALKLDNKILCAATAAGPAFEGGSIDCGSKIVDIVSFLLSEGMIHPSGYMEKPYKVSEDVSVSPKDIRDIQLAKAAIMAGIKTLLIEADLSINEIEKLIIAGGFGYNLSIENSIQIGLIPAELAGKIEILGNTSLAGAIRYSIEKKAFEEINNILKMTEYVELSSHIEFNQKYIEEMPFNVKEKEMKTKIFLITGYLGAGKTTFLKNQLLKSDGKVGVLMNEFGKISIDTALVKKKELSFVELVNGSIFCSCLKDDFINGLVKLVNQNLNFIYIESSGLADQSNMAKLVEIVEKESYGNFEFCGTICILDGLYFYEELNKMSVVEKQIRHSHIIVINKCDLISQDKIVQIKKDVTNLNEKAQIFEAVNGLMDCNDEILDKNCFYNIESKESSNKIDNKPKTITISFKDKVCMDRVQQFLENISIHFYRIKGIIIIDGKWHNVNTVHRQIEIIQTNIEEESQYVDRYSKGYLVFLTAHGLDSYQVLRTTLDDLFYGLYGISMS